MDIGLHGPSGQHVVLHVVLEIDRGEEIVTTLLPNLEAEDVLELTLKMDHAVQIKIAQLMGNGTPGINGQHVVPHAMVELKPEEGHALNHNLVASPALEVPMTIELVVPSNVPLTLLGQFGQVGAHVPKLVEVDQEEDQELALQLKTVVNPVLEPLQMNQLVTPRNVSLLAHGLNGAVGQLAVNHVMEALDQDQDPALTTTVLEMDLRMEDAMLSPVVLMECGVNGNFGDLVV